VSKTFFTADWHLGDRRLDILHRPFTDSEAMRKRLIENHNRLVTPEDRVYVIGDAIHSASDTNPATLSAFNGHKILIKGNHDQLDDSEYLKHFLTVVPEGEGLELEIEGLPCWLTHYPRSAREDFFNLVGHVHGCWRVQKNMLNVGVDAHHFRPVSAKDVIFQYQAICEHYDEDIWSSDNPANLAHRSRGRAGHY